MRAIWSDAPPAPAATTISTGLVGSHASAGALANTIASAAPVQRQVFLISGIASSPRDVTGRWPKMPRYPCCAYRHSAALRLRCKGADAPRAARDPWSLDRGAMVRALVLSA